MGYGQPVYGNVPPPQPYGPAKQKNPPEDVKRRKLFVGALGGITEQAFYTYFQKFGPIEDYLIFRDQTTGESKGYGFVVFKDHASAQAVLEQKGQHYVNGKWVDCKQL